MILIVGDATPRDTMKNIFQNLGHVVRELSVNTLQAVQAIGNTFEINLIYIYPSAPSFFYGNFGVELSQAGYAVAMGMSNNYPSNSNSVAIPLGLLKDIPSYYDYMYSSSDNTQLVTVSNNDFFINSQATVAGTSLVVKTTRNPWNNYISVNQVADYYVPLASPKNHSDKYCLGYIPKGTWTGKYTTGSVVFHLGFLYDEGLTGSTIDILKDVLDYAMLVNNPPYSVNGTVVDLEKNPLQRKIRAYDPSTGRLLKEVTSDVDGKYNFKLVTNTPVYLVYVPEGSEKPDIHYNVIPQEISEE